MAAKFSIVATSFCLLVIIATASVTITTVEIDEATNPAQRCQQQLKRQTLENCEEFLTKSSRGRMMMNASCRQQMKKCCTEIKEIDEECRCQGIEKMMQRQQHGEMTERMTEKAMELPRMCGVSPGRCEIHRSFY